MTRAEAVARIEARFGAVAPPECQKFWREDAALFRWAEWLERTERPAALLGALRHGLDASALDKALLQLGDAVSSREASQSLEKLALRAPIALVDSAAAWGVTLDYMDLMRSYAQSQNIDETQAKLTQLAEEYFVDLATRLAPEIAIIAVGALAQGDVDFALEVEICLVVPDAGLLPKAESHARNLEILTAVRHAEGFPLTVSWFGMGPKRQRVWTQDGLLLYQLASMTPFERFKLSASSVIVGAESDREWLKQLSVQPPWPVERMDAALLERRTVESRQVEPKYVTRDLLWGPGGLSDVEWLVRLHELRTIGSGEANKTIDERIRDLARRGEWNAAEAGETLEGRLWLNRLRFQLTLLGFTPHILPENPDKLDRLATAIDLPSGNALLAMHERVTSSLREITNEGLERLRR